jgi:hypothetical protein
MPSQINPALTRRIPNAGSTLIGSLANAFNTRIPMYQIPKDKKQTRVRPTVFFRSGGDEPQQPGNHADDTDDNRDWREIVHGVDTLPAG